MQGQRVHRPPCSQKWGCGAELGLQVACPLKQGHVCLLLTCRTGQRPAKGAWGVCVCVCVRVSAHGCTEEGRKGRGLKHGGLPGLGSPQGRAAAVAWVPGAEAALGHGSRAAHQCPPLKRSSGISRTQQPWPGAMPQAPSGSPASMRSRGQEAQSPSLGAPQLHTRAAGFLPSSRVPPGTTTC